MLGCPGNKSPTIAGSILGPPSPGSKYLDLEVLDLIYYTYNGFCDPQGSIVTYLVLYTAFYWEPTKTIVLVVYGRDVQELSALEAQLPLKQATAREAARAMWLHVAFIWLALSP